MFIKNLMFIKNTTLTFIRNITTRCVIILTIVSLFVSLFIGLPLAVAYPDPDANNYEYKTTETNLDNALRKKDTWENRYEEAIELVNDYSSDNFPIDI